MIAPDELLPDRSHRRPVAVQVAFVAAYEPERSFSEGSLRSEAPALVPMLDSVVQKYLDVSKSCLSAGHGTEFAVPASEAPGTTDRRARSIELRRSKTAAISAEEMRAPPRFAPAGVARSGVGWGSAGG
jgi:hypothetical protein